MNVAECPRCKAKSCIVVSPDLSGAAPGWAAWSVHCDGCAEPGDRIEYGRTAEAAMARWNDAIAEETETARVFCMDCGGAGCGGCAFQGSLVVSR